MKSTVDPLLISGCRLVTTACCILTWVNGELTVSLKIRVMDKTFPSGVL